MESTMEFLTCPSPALPFCPDPDRPLPLYSEADYDDDSKLEIRLLYVETLRDQITEAACRFMNSEAYKADHLDDQKNFELQFRYSIRLDETIEQPRQFANSYSKAVCDVYNAKHCHDFSAEKLRHLREKVLALDKQMATFRGLFTVLSPETKEFMWDFARLRIMAIHDRYAGYLTKDCTNLQRTNEDIKAWRHDSPLASRLKYIFNGLVGDLARPSLPPNDTFLKPDDPYANHFTIEKISECATVLSVDREAMFFTLIHHSIFTSRRSKPIAIPPCLSSDAATTTPKPFSRTV
jgi:hypothetical protein